MKYYVLNLDEEPLLWGEDLLVFDNAASAHRFMEVAKRLYGFSMADYLVVNTYDHPVGIVHDVIDATNLVPHIGEDKTESLVEA